MRTTLTLDDDLARKLKDIARRADRSFKDVVNETLRRGLQAGDEPIDRPPPFEVEPKACGLRPGIDVYKLNQLVDELEIQRFGDRVVRDAEDR